MVTVFTPTYNRCNLLYRLYDSLKRQTSQNFEWLVVDDGSTDGTKEQINKWRKENLFPIKYIYQENRGKPSAFNNAVKNAEGEMFFCVDSDDYLTDDAVKKIIDAFNQINDNVAGLLALKVDENENLLSDRLPKDIEYSKSHYLSEKYNCRGEFSFVYKTEILKKYPYPIIEGEKFIGECVVYDNIDKKYDMFLLNEVLTICEYQGDGLTNNLVRLMINNPTGYQIYHMQRIDMVTSLKKRIGHCIKYNAFRFFSKNKDYRYKGKYKLLSLLTVLPGLAAALYYKSKEK